MTLLRRPRRMAQLLPPPAAEEEHYWSTKRTPSHHQFTETPISIAARSIGERLAIFGAEAPSSVVAEPSICSGLSVISSPFRPSWCPPTRPPGHAFGARHLHRHSATPCH